MAEKHTKIVGGVGQEQPHDSAHLHVTGGARYVDDLPEPKNLLHAALGVSTVARGEIESLELDAAAALAGVVAVIKADDIPGRNHCGPIIDDDPILAAKQVEYVGQVIFAVAATTLDEARRATRAATVKYRSLTPILDIRTAIREASFVLPSETLTRGDAHRAIALAPHELSGEVSVGGQDQFYLEGQIAMAVPGENGDVKIYSSTQHPAEIQHLVAGALNKQAKDITVECRRMGGAFGGKESQAALFACVVALLTEKTGRPVKLRVDRDEDMIITGKRHDFDIDYRVGFSETGLIQGIEFTLASRCGMSADLSGPVNDRAMFHCDNAYYLSDVTIISHRCKTNTVSNTAFRGFGGPQGMFAIEYVMDEIARELNLDPLAVRSANFYQIHPRNVTPYQQIVEDNIIDPLVHRLVETSDYAARRTAIRSFNETNEHHKKGIALTPVKFGISFTATHLNQAGALIHVYADGSVQLNHGGTEMGQGLFIKVAQIVAEIFQIDVGNVKITATDTGKVPNTSATAASSGCDLNGQAAAIAATEIKQRMTTVAAKHFHASPDKVVFRSNRVFVDQESLSFGELAALAQFERVSLSATGYYRTPKIHYDRATFSGRPFYYFAYGAAVSEVIVDTLTGEYKTLRVDILHDCGKSLNPAIDVGQIEGGFVQGAGWLTSEELWWNDLGELQTHAPSTYKIPVASDLPADFRVSLFESMGDEEAAVYRSKAVGEPPLMLALSVFHAIKDAVASTSSISNARPKLDAPATPERVLASIISLQKPSNSSLVLSDPP